MEFVGYRLLPNIRSAISICVELKFEYSRIEHLKDFPLFFRLILEQFNKERNENNSIQFIQAVRNKTKPRIRIIVVVSEMPLYNLDRQVNELSRKVEFVYKV